MSRVFDGHNDTLTRLDGRSFFVKSSTGHIDLPRAQKGGLGGGFFAIFTAPPPGNPERDLMNGTTFTKDGYIVSERSPLSQDYAQAYTDSIIELAEQLEAESDGKLRIVRRYSDLERSFAQDVLSVVLAIEGAEAIKEDLSNLEAYYRRGVRAIGPVWSRPNCFGYGVPFRFPHSPDTGPGLHESGKALVKACNELGILIDLAHLNAKGFWDVAALSTAPLVVTHAD